MAQVLHGLLANAAKYAPGSPVRVSLAHALDEIAIRVEDDGPGIDPEYWDLVFDRGFRLDPNGLPGSGIGLAVARRMVRSQDGDLWVESSPERRRRLRDLDPRGSGAQDRARTRRRYGEAPGGRPTRSRRHGDRDRTAGRPHHAAVEARVAIVEDHDLLAQSLGFALSNLGIHVTRVADLRAEAVIETLEGCELDLVLLDFDLGEAGIGLHLVRPITQLGLRVVMLTGETNRIVLAECVEAGAMGIISKREPFERLIEQVSDVVSGRNILSVGTRELLMSELRAAPVAGRRAARALRPPDRPGERGAPGPHRGQERGADRQRQLRLGGDGPVAHQVAPRQARRQQPARRGGGGAARRVELAPHVPRHAQLTRGTARRAGTGPEPAFPEC